jgi:hypothetical protein
MFVVFGGWCGWQAWRAWTEGRMDFIEASFAAQNAIMITLILIRSRPRSIDRNPAHQAVPWRRSTRAFFSWAARNRRSRRAIDLGNRHSRGQPVGRGGAGLPRPHALAFSSPGARSSRAAFTRSSVTDVWLGHSASHRFSRQSLLWTTAALFVLSTGCYVWRALLRSGFWRKPPNTANISARSLALIPGIFCTKRGARR